MFVLAVAAAAAPQGAQAQRLLGRPVASASSGLVASRSVESRGSSSLLPVPVEGIRREQLRDTYNQSRSEGRTHHAIDIHAPRGTPVIAVADGTIRKLHSGARGGLAIYLMDDDGTTRYYYAHLDGYAQGLREGQRVERGEIIGYVGDTGNAQPGDYHLHFSVAVLDSPSRWWEGENLNPYDLLHGRSDR
jgi:murein DD-endopeptidase MepM/ murein hydrolase activator NlpD